MMTFLRDLHAMLAVRSSNECAESGTTSMPGRGAQGLIQIPLNVLYGL